MNLMDWNEFFSTLSDEEKDALAILRMIETTNGVIQHAFREKREYALSTEDTRAAMKYSMGCMKRMEIPLGDEVLTFSEPTKEVLLKVRELYISGFKNGNVADHDEFMQASASCIQALGWTRIVEACKRIERDLKNPIAEHVSWGRHYAVQFLA